MLFLNVSVAKPGFLKGGGGSRGFGGGPLAIRGNRDLGAKPAAAGG